jgi:hypothetical protein
MAAIRSADVCVRAQLTRSAGGQRVDQRHAWRVGVRIGVSDFGLFRRLVRENAERGASLRNAGRMWPIRPRDSVVSVQEARVSIWARNVQLAAFSIPLCVVSLFATSDVRAAPVAVPFVKCA